jgi:Fe2+ transport system protein B
MVDKMIIIYNFNGYKDPKIKDVELTRVNGYKTVITKEGEERMTEEHKLKYLGGSDAKKILELADQEGVNVEDLLSSIKNSIKKGKGESKMTYQEDDERFNKEVKIVEKYQEDHPGISYRDAVLASLDRTEPVVKKEFTAEEIKEQENLKTVENYLDANPRASYSEACKVLFKGEKPTLREKLIEEYLEKNPKADYREAIIESSSLLEKEPKKEE